MSILQIPSPVEFSATVTYNLSQAPSLQEATRIMQSLLLHLPATTGSNEASSSSSSSSAALPVNIPRNIIVFTELYLSTLTAAKALHLHTGKIATVLGMLQSLIQQCQQNHWPEDYTLITKLWETMLAEHTNTSLPYRAGPNGTSHTNVSSVLGGEEEGEHGNTFSIGHDKHNNAGPDTLSIATPHDSSINSLGSVPIIDDEQVSQHNHSVIHNPSTNTESNNSPPLPSNSSSSSISTDNVSSIPEIEKLRSGEAQAITEYFTTFGFLRHYHYYKYICTVPLPTQTLRLIVPIDTPLTTLPLDDATIVNDTDKAI